MPPFAATIPLLYSVTNRDIITNISDTATATPLTQVVCAWPVSGQYGFGTRILYYILVATCVLARKREWLRNACLAAALLLPAVAAIHAVVLAAVHTDHVVDMDIYGAFQICSIGILAAPITVYNSKTYFNDPGRNIIFLWTGLLLAGMLSLTVEFFRIEPVTCSLGAIGECIPQCAFSRTGPFSSPIRQDSTNEPAVIDVPTRLSFSAVTLLAAGSSIPPVLTLIFTWEKILEINWKRIWARDEPDLDEPIEGTNGATPKMITVINGAIRNFLTSIQIPIFSGIVVVLLVLGELNFWSAQVSYQTEPFSSIGQWANVVATVLVILGSLFYVRHEKEYITDEKWDAGSHHSHITGGNKTHHTLRPPSMIHIEHATCNNCGHRDAQSDVSLDEQHDTSFGPGSIDAGTVEDSMSPELLGHRSLVAQKLDQVASWFVTPKQAFDDDSAFRGSQKIFPSVPGEEQRVPNFEGMKSWYADTHAADDDRASRLSRPSISSFHSPDSGGPSNRDRSPSRPPRSRSRASTTPAGRNELSPSGLSRIRTLPSTSLSRAPTGDTLDVPHRPRPAHFRPGTATSFRSSQSTPLNTEGPPKIVVSAVPENRHTSPTSPTRDNGEQSGSQ